MPTKNLTQTLYIQALKQHRLQHEFAWITLSSVEELLNF